MHALLSALGHIHAAELMRLQASPDTSIHPHLSYSTSYVACLPYVCPMFAVPLSHPTPQFVPDITYTYSTAWVLSK